MKKYFKFDRHKNQYSLHYKGVWFHFDKDDFEQMSDQELHEIIKNSTTQKEQPKKQEDNVSYDELKAGFDVVRDFMRERPDMSFKQYVKMRGNI